MTMNRCSQNHSPFLEIKMKKKKSNSKSTNRFEPRENRLFAYAKTKRQISFAVKLISAFVFATRIVQSPFFLNPKFQASSHLPQLNSPVCVRPGQKPRRPVFSQRGSFSFNVLRKHEVKVGSGSRLHGHVSMMPDFD